MNALTSSNLYTQEKVALNAPNTFLFYRIEYQSFPNIFDCPYSMRVTKTKEIIKQNTSTVNFVPLSKIETLLAYRYKAAHSQYVNILRAFL